jgi:mRNA interferase MazF
MVRHLKTGKKLMASYPEQRSIYWFDPEPIIGSELQKVRPCIVVSPNEMNKKLKTVLVIPLTSSIKPWPFRVTITFLGHKSSAACDQSRVIDKSRLKAYIGSLKKSDSDKLFGMIASILSD